MLLNSENYRRNNMKILLKYIATHVFLATLFLMSQPIKAQIFTNPLLPSGADPWSIYKDGYYYYTHTTGNRIDLWKTKTLAGLKDAERKTIWKAPAGTEAT